MTGELFGTDGIRGKANQEPITPRTLSRVGQALGTFWSRDSSRREVLLGHDGRRSSQLVQNALSAGLMSVGLDVRTLGLCSTPSLAYLTRRTDAAVGGVVLSASHNPFFDNGVKPFRSDGRKLEPETEQALEELIAGDRFDWADPEHIGTMTPVEASLEPYVTALNERDVFFEGHVVVDCANGGTSGILPDVLPKVCSDFTLLNHDPNGFNINSDCGSTHMNGLCETVRHRGGDVGFALDGDGDRLLAVDSQGGVVDGDILMYMLAKHYHQQGELPGGGLVVTLMSNLGLRRALQAQDIQFEVVGVGDRNVFEKLVARDWRLGGEQSGHVIDRRWLPTGDGVHTMLSVLDVITGSGRTLRDWSDEVNILPQVLHNVRVPRKPPLSRLEQTKLHIREIEDQLAEQGRINVRYSGTQPLVRIMLEGPDQDRLDELAGELGETLKKEIESREAPSR